MQRRARMRRCRSHRGVVVALLVYNSKANDGRELWRAGLQIGMCGAMQQRAQRESTPAAQMPSVSEAQKGLEDPQPGTTGFQVVAASLAVLPCRTGYCSFDPPRA